MGGVGGVDVVYCASDLRVEWCTQNVPHMWGISVSRSPGRPARSGRRPRPGRAGRPRRAGRVGRSGRAGRPGEGDTSCTILTGLPADNDVRTTTVLHFNDNGEKSTTTVKYIAGTEICAFNVLPRAADVSAKAGRLRAHTATWFTTPPPPGRGSWTRCVTAAACRAWRLEAWGHRPS
eukprot:gene9828-biopygen7720